MPKSNKSVVSASRFQSLQDEVTEDSVADSSEPLLDNAQIQFKARVTSSKTKKTHKAKPVLQDISTPPKEFVTILQRPSKPTVERPLPASTPYLDPKFVQSFRNAFEKIATPLDTHISDIVVDEAAIPKEPPDEGEDVAIMDTGYKDTGNKAKTVVDADMTSPMEDSRVSGMT